MSVGYCRFFPDTNILVGIVLREHRFGPQNLIYLNEVERHKLENTVLPTVESEFRTKLDRVVDLCAGIADRLLYTMNLAKTRDLNASVPVFVDASDIPLVMDSFQASYLELSRGLSDEDRNRFQTSFDLISSWVMSGWSPALGEGRTIKMEDFVDSLKLTISEGRRELEDAYSRLKAQLCHIPCDWTPDSQLSGKLSSYVPDQDDVKHLSLAGTFVVARKGRGLFITNDAGILNAGSHIAKDCGLVVVRPAFAYATFLNST